MNMFGTFGRVLADWSVREPSASLLMFVTAVLLFGVVFIRLRQRQEETRGLFTRSLVASVVFIGVIGVFYFLIDSSYKNFQPVAEAIAKGEDFMEQVRETQKTWGGTIYQNELTISHTRSYVIVEEIFVTEKPSLYRNKTIVEEVDQESLVGFSGSVDIRRVDERLNTYIANARYEYNVENQSEFETTAHFRFSLYPQHTYQQVTVLVNGHGIELPAKMTLYNLEWDVVMRPHEKISVEVSYVARGMASYYYRIPLQRDIGNFSLVISVDSRAVYVSTTPNSSAINFHSERSGDGYRLAWTIDRAIMTPQLGIQFKSFPVTDKSQEAAIRILRYMPRGLMLFATVFVLTLITCGSPVDLKKYFLLMALFSSPFLATMGLDLLKVNYLTALIIASLIALLFSFKLYRNLSRFPLILVSALTSLFMLGYPFAGFLKEGPQRISFDTAVQAGILLYIFGLTLYTRVRKANSV